MVTRNVDIAVRAAELRWRPPRLADHCADELEVVGPSGLFAKLGVTLRVDDRALRLPGRVVYGTWDPLLRRIELFACDAERSDAEIVGALGHELWHAIRSRRPGADRDTRGSDRSPENEENMAARFAQALLDRLGPQRVQQCAAALRSKVVPRASRWQLEESGAGLGSSCVQTAHRSILSIAS